MLERFKQGKACQRIQKEREAFQIIQVSVVVLALLLLGLKAILKTMKYFRSLITQLSSKTSQFPNQNNLKFQNKWNEALLLSTEQKLSNTFKLKSQHLKRTEFDDNLFLLKQVNLKKGQKLTRSKILQKCYIKSKLRKRHPKQIKFE